MSLTTGGVSGGGRSPLWDLFYDQLNRMQQPGQGGQDAGQAGTGLPLQQQLLLDGIGFPPHMMQNGNAVTGLDATPTAFTQGAGGINAGQFLQNMNVRSPDMLGNQQRMLSDLQEMSVGELAERLKDPSFVRGLTQLLQDPRMGSQILNDGQLMQKIAGALLQRERLDDPNFRAQPGSRLEQAMQNDDMGVFSDPEMAALIAELLNKRNKQNGGGGARGGGGGGGGRGIGNGVGGGRALNAGGPGSAGVGNAGSAGPTTPSATANAVNNMTSAEAGQYKQLLDFIAGPESGRWGYDAMNEGGTNGGHTVVGRSGAAADILGKPLTSMTVGEVMDLQAQGRLHAAGRYQIIGKTLKGLVDQGVVSRNDMFDAATQDKLGIALIEGRRGQGMRGMRQEWIGLQYVADADLRRAMSTVGMPA